MKRNLILISHALLAVASLHSLSNADVQITGRSTLMSTTIDFGYVGSVTTTTESKVSTTIDDTVLTMQGAASDGGPLGDVSWDAVYQFGLDQQLVPGSSTGFGGSGSTGLFTFAGGDGVSYLSATNRLEVVFENSQSTAFDLFFIATDTSSLDLEQMTSPGNWANVHTIPGGSGGEISTTVQLPAGVFRVTTATNVNTDNAGSNAGSWLFSITAVPEPSSMGLLAISTSWLILGRRRMAP